MQYQKGLILKYDEPFEVVKKIDVVAYKLKLLESLISLYPSFHVSFLKPYYKDPDIWKQFNCEIACILKHMKMRNWKKKMDWIFGSQENDARKWNKLGERNYLMAVQRLSEGVFTYYVDKDLDSTWWERSLLALCFMHITPRLHEEHLDSMSCLWFWQGERLRQMWLTYGLLGWLVVRMHK